MSDKQQITDEESHENQVETDDLLLDDEQAPFQNEDEMLEMMLETEDEAASEALMLDEEIETDAKAEMNEDLEDTLQESLANADTEAPLSDEPAEKSLIDAIEEPVENELTLEDDTAEAMLAAPEDEAPAEDMLLTVEESEKEATESEQPAQQLDDENELAPIEDNAPDSPTSLDDSNHTDQTGRLLNALVNFTHSVNSNISARQANLPQTNENNVTTPTSVNNIEEMTLAEIETLLIDNMEKLTALISAPINTYNVQVSANDPSKEFATAIHHYKNEMFHKAAKWMRKAAMKGHVKAQFYLGIMFLKGEGLPKSIYHSYSWLTLAASQDNQEALAAKSQLEKKLTSLEINSASKLAAERYEQIHNFLQGYN
ncbi:SEL1-like repeat protein [Flocculibacter collagenilyticus]|uniref:SEL1-like repeat protein n=1 Tax=Flocculibacter collagenilyticus TaxID=2744479 RepID=UPI0018F2A8FA|nr:SEL1-like repeat protein [Flocculibacter collagenilyticus]